MKKQAFTLAEVLITLSIIGVVAALTIPSLVVKNQEKQTVVQLKKAYNVLSNAFSLAVVEYGEPSGWGWTAEGSSQGAINAMDKFSPYLNLMNRCNASKGCFGGNTIYKTYIGGAVGSLDSNTDAPKAVLADGMFIRLYSYGSTCNMALGDNAFKNTCGDVSIDINGAKAPNAYGKDLFFFRITNDGVFPAGLSDDKSAPLESTCAGGSGMGCTAWVLLKENMDYPPAGTGWE